MKKVKMQPFSSMTFEEGCEKHFLYCRQRNLSETTLIRYRACYSLYYKFFDPDMPLDKIDAEMYNAYIFALTSPPTEQVRPLERHSHFFCPNTKIMYSFF